MISIVTEQISCYAYGAWTHMNVLIYFAKILNLLTNSNQFIFNYVYDFRKNTILIINTVFTILKKKRCGQLISRDINLAVEESKIKPVNESHQQFTKKYEVGYSCFIIITVTEEITYLTQLQGADSQKNLRYPNLQGTENWHIFWKWCAKCMVKVK